MLTSPVRTLLALLGYLYLLNSQAKAAPEAPRLGRKEVAGLAVEANQVWDKGGAIGPVQVAERSWMREMVGRVGSV